jgi:hypothetical protein
MCFTVQRFARLLPILLDSERHVIDWLTLIYLNQPSPGAFLDREHFMNRAIRIRRLSRCMGVEA